MNKRLKELETLGELLDVFTEYLWVFDFMRPRGDGAKAEAVREFKVATSDVIRQIRKIEKRQIREIYSE